MQAHKVCEHRRNEVGSKISARNVQSVINGKNDPWVLLQQRQATTGIDDSKRCKIRHEAHFKLQRILVRCGKKYYNIILRRLEKGQNYHIPHFGCREFCKCGSLQGRSIQTAYTGTKDLGYMLYDMDYSDPNDIKPKFSSDYDGWRNRLDGMRGGTDTASADKLL